MRVGSLFSGIGGIELGLERAGLGEAVWFVENEPHAQTILRKHWPSAEVYGDITTLDFAAVPAIDILTGGFPCQDISNAGRRVGITGSRSSLWKHYLRGIGVLRPRIVIIENVAALKNRGLEVVLCDLAALGYDAEWHCISASAVGAPHRRDRMFIIAHPQCDGLDESSERECTETSSDEGRLSESQRCLVSSDAISENVGDSRRTASQRNPAGVLGAQETSESKRLEDGNCRLRPSDASCQAGARNGGAWVSEPALGRLADGVPYRVDRIKRLGNAVVPQVAEAVGQAIKDVEK